MPVFARAIVPNAGGAEYAGEIDIPVHCGGLPVQPGDWIVGDDDGVTVVPADRLEEVLPAAESLREVEERIAVKVAGGRDPRATAALRRDPGSETQGRRLAPAALPRTATEPRARSGSETQPLQCRTTDESAAAWQHGNCPNRCLTPRGICFASSVPVPFSSRLPSEAARWLVGPALAVQYGVGLLWIATAAIVLQLLFNLEAIRYTLYTGEPIITGFMRLKPGASFWATVYGLLCLAQLGLPASPRQRYGGVLDRSREDARRCGWRRPHSCDLRRPDSHARPAPVRRYRRAHAREDLLGDGRVHLRFLVLVNVLFVPFGNWLATLAGFGSFGTLPTGVDVVLVGALAASAGSGGIGNWRSRLG